MKVALMQLQVSGQETAADRWLHVEHLLGRLQGEAIDLIVLPELWGVGYYNFDFYETEAEPLKGVTISRLIPWARTLHSYIITGSFVEGAGQHRYFNTTAMIDTHGFLLDAYRKIHLGEAQERRCMTAGTQTCEVYTSSGIIGMASGYDVWFPEQFRQMTDNGAAMFAVCSAWPEQQLENWHMLCRVRAMENQCFLLACNHAGMCGGIQGAGHSMIVAPDGSILVQAKEDEEILIAEVDMNDAERYRRQFPVLHDRTAIN